VKEIRAKRNKAKEIAGLLESRFYCLQEGGSVDLKPGCALALKNVHKGLLKDEKFDLEGLASGVERGIPGYRDWLEAIYDISQKEGESRPDVLRAAINRCMIKMGEKVHVPSREEQILLLLGQGSIGHA
jgi:hypothetical protein